MDPSAIAESNQLRGRKSFSCRMILCLVYRPADSEVGTWKPRRVTAAGQVTHRAEPSFSSQEDMRVVVEASESLAVVEKARHKDRLARWDTLSFGMRKDAASLRR